MPQDSLNKQAITATLHCLTGCAIGEVLGLVVGTALGLSNLATISLAIVLAFIFGYILTILPLLRAGLTITAALGVALAADTASIGIMEIVDNLVMVTIPGAMNAGLVNPLFWVALPVSLGIAFLAAAPINRYLIRRNLGHALVHQYHEKHHKHHHH